MSINKDSIKAVKFLNIFRKQGYINLVSIDPVTNVIAGITRLISSPDILQFVETYNGKSNLYFTVNEPHPTAPDNKLRKDHIKFINALYVDIDPDKRKDFLSEKKRIIAKANDLNSSVAPPSYIIDSGGGSQAFWLLDNPHTHSRLRSMAGA